MSAAIDDPSTEFERLARELDRLEQIAEEWPAEQKAAVMAVRSTVEEIMVGAMRSMIRTIRDEPGGLDALKKAVEDPWVRNVLTYHGLLKPPQASPEEKVEAALESVRPMLASHGGNVQLESVVSPEEVRIRLEGSCDGCAHSDVTVRQGIETAIKEALPSVERVKVVAGTRGDALVQLPGVTHSPFDAKHWHDVASADELAEGTLRVVELDTASVLLTRARGKPRAYQNACAHLGMPLDDGEVRDGVLTCPFHGFQFLLESGECLTAPQVQLPSYPTQVREGRVWVQVLP